RISDLSLPSLVLGMSTSHQYYHHEAGTLGENAYNESTPNAPIPVTTAAIPIATTATMSPPLVILSFIIKYIKYINITDIININNNTHLFKMIFSVILLTCVK